MRTIKFRGYSEELDEWLFGYLVGDQIFIDQDQEGDRHGFYDVIPETIGEFTGLIDKHDAEIYEGDILALTIGNREVFYHKCMFAIRISGDIVAPIFHEPGEIIGNIHGKD